MADEEAKVYLLKREDGNETAFSKDYTGYGIADYENGDKYEGQFKDGVREGKGKYTYANQDYYEGDFVNNYKHGIGKLVYPVQEDENTGKKTGGGEYFGYFEKGKKQGEGLYTYPNKDIYQGFWKNSKKHGQGTYVYNSTGIKLQGEWNEGQIFSGKWIFPNGDYYEGKFKYNQPIGEGKWQFINGNTLQGSYKQIIIPSINNTQSINIKLEWISQNNYESNLPPKPLITFQKPQFIFVLGGPGAGKGTQCAKLVGKYNFKHLSTGDLLRAEKDKNTPEAEMINNIMAEGKLVPSELLVQLVKNEVLNNKNQNKSPVYLLDGFPRNMENLEIWDRLMTDLVEVKFLLLFECSMEVMEERLLGRAQTSGRVDDNPEAIKKRFETFEAQTKPVIQQYRGIVEKVNANKNVDEIFEDTRKVFKKHQIVK